MMKIMEKRTKTAPKEPSFIELLRGKKFSAAKTPEDENRKITIDLFAGGITQLSCSPITVVCTVTAKHEVEIVYIIKVNGYTVKKILASGRKTA